MKIRLICILIVLLNLKAFGQKTIYRNWYIPVEHKYVKLEIDKDSITVKKYRVMPNPKSNKNVKDYVESRIEKTIQVKNMIRIITSTVIDSMRIPKQFQGTFHPLVFSVYSFSFDTIRNEYLMLFDIKDTLFSSFQAAEKYVKNNTPLKFGIFMYPEEAYNDFAKLKKIETMTKQDYIKAKDITTKAEKEFDKSFSNIKSDYKSWILRTSGYLISVYSKAVIDLGYNPYIESRVMDDLTRKYSSE
jgi:hypothetical protein